MTTATAAPNEGLQDQTSLDVEQDDAASLVETDDILTGQGGDDTEGDSAAAEAAMLAGWERADASGVRTTDTETAADASKNDVDDADAAGAGEADATGATGQPAANANDEDPEVPGLGMRASQVRAALGRLDALEKSTASTAGHLGHLKQLVSQQAGKGKGLTKEQLKNVAGEFGDEFAEALARDLSEVGLGGGPATAVPDQAAIDEMVNARLTEHTRATEKRRVQRAHPDADDHFARPKVDAQGQPVVNDKGEPEWEAGPKHAAFVQFVGTLPVDRQRELQENGWDSEVIGRALSDFKNHEKKAKDDAARQTRRTERAAAPTRSGGNAVQPVVDPLMEGWNRAGGSTRPGARR